MQHARRTLHRVPSTAPALDAVRRTKHGAARPPHTAPRSEHRTRTRRGAAHEMRCGAWVVVPRSGRGAGAVQARCRDAATTEAPLIERGLRSVAVA
ncbi:hypothetical protein FFA01_29970 [Frigoribacterium faeni]|uniref:Uncharacterized protein n=1 Tax=Frigoribacterium faeni TaxID=145483 RepID=A0ABQ0UT87_9MICO|nr:hypothetical protein GCM10025699_58600 [Microbacterium flavescens]GEK84688.1 hypothetical protein FFA01_29970 [Frigoribacterium faeni]